MKEEKEIKKTSATKKTSTTKKAGVTKKNPTAKNSVATKKTSATKASAVTKKPIAKKTEVANETSKTKKTTVSKKNSAGKKEPTVQKSTRKKSATTTSPTSKTTSQSRKKAQSVTTNKSSKKETSTLQSKPSVVKSDSVKQEKDMKSKRVLEQVVIEQEIDDVNPIAEEVSFDQVETSNNLSKERKEIPISNYLIVAIIVVWVFILAFIGYKLYQKYQEQLYQEGYFIHEKTDIKKINLNDVSDIINRSKGSVFVLFNYRGYEETYQLEKDLDQIIQDYHLKDSFYYVDVTDVSTANCTMECMVNSELHMSSFQHVPAIAFYQNGRLIEIAQREDQKVLEAADFVKVLDMYEIKK